MLSRPMTGNSPQFDWTQESKKRMSWTGVLCILSQQQEKRASCCDESFSECCCTERSRGQAGQICSSHRTTAGDLTSWISTTQTKIFKDKYILAREAKGIIIVGGDFNCVLNLKLDKLPLVHAPPPVKNRKQQNTYFPTGNSWLWQEV